MPTAYAYIRYSHLEQARGLTEQFQGESIQRYYDFRQTAPDSSLCGVPLHPEPFVDRGVSAWKFDLRDRPDGARLVRALQPGDHVLLYKVDRAFRDVADGAAMMKLWKEEGVTVHIMDLAIDLNTAAGGIIYNVMLAFAQGESDMKSERIKAGMATRRNQGRPINSYAGYGYRWQGQKGHKRRVASEIDLSIMQEIARLRDEETKSWREISDAIELLLSTEEEYTRSAFRPPSWSNQKCMRAYKRWKEMNP